METIKEKTFLITKTVDSVCMEGKGITVAEAYGELSHAIMVNAFKEALEENFKKSAQMLSMPEDLGVKKFKRLQEKL